MDSSVILLFVVGLILLGFEVVVPGAILGIAGGAFLLIGVVVAFLEHGREGGLLALGVAVAAVAGILYLELAVLPRTRFGKRMFLKAEIDGTSQPVIAGGDVIGKEAVAMTALAPTGLVQVEGKRYEARCDSGFAEEGARLRVVRIESFQLVVMAEVAV